MGLNQRNDYFWHEGRVIKKVAHRPSGDGRWRRTGPETDRIISIEQYPDRTEGKEGPAYTASRGIKAWNMELGRESTINSPDIGRSLPAPALAQVRKVVQSASDAIAKRFARFGGEVPATGALIERLSTDITIGSWRIEIAPQGFSSVGENAKEGKTGADLGVVIDIYDGTHRVSKAMLMQAKLDYEFPDDIRSLKDMPEQLKKMKKRTNESYGIVYTPLGVAAYRSDAPTVRIGFADIMVEAVQCERGDRSEIVIADALDRDFTLDVFVTKE